MQNSPSDPEELPLERAANPPSADDPRLAIPDVLKRPVPKPESMRAAERAEGQSESTMLGMARAWGVALDFIFTIFAGAAIGWGIDHWQKTSPKGLMGGLALGFVIAFIRIVRGTIKQDRLEQARRNQKRP